ncbi:MAG TPA: RIP metalloprotease RseP [Nitrospiraceae bacterium]|nr:RIP metalloprotease RseP [Nitrospiraceae bacterium]
MIDRDGEKMSFVLRPEVATEFKIGSSGLVPDMLVEIGAITSGFPADKAGIRLHDKILAVDGKTIYHWNQFARSVRESSGKPMKFAIERDNRRTSVTVSAIESSGTYVIGVQPFQNLVITKHGFFESLSLGFHKTIEVIDLTFITLKKLMTFSLSIKTLGGPVMIAQMSGQAAEIGLSAFLGLLAMVSVSLGILNLLPIPVLDGGLLVFLGIEAVRKKPLSEKTMQIAQNVGAVLLIGLIVVVSYNDVMRVFFNN